MAKQLEATDGFRDRIKELLDERAVKDPLFATVYKKPNKNIEDCVTFILNKVSHSKVNGYTTEEIVGLAMHYYDEDDLKPGHRPPVKRIVIDQPTAEEKQQAREEALKRYTVELHKRVTGRKVKTPGEDKNQKSLF